ncbi:MAG: T9SS type A sorting domain-containing protein [Candidatus Zixiibacteriota bacterium]
MNDFLVSQDYSASEQNYPSIAVGLGGKFAVIWSDLRNGDGDVYCRLYDSGAIPLTNEFMLNDDAADAWQLEPDLSSDWYGNYFAVWKDYRNNAYPFDPDIYFQKLDSTGTIGVNKNITTESPDSSHQSPAIGATGWGKSIIAWADLRNTNWDIYAQVLDDDGNDIGVNHRVNDDVSTTPQHEPQVALSPNGWYVVVWYDRRSGNDDVFMQKFDSSGTPISYNRKVNDDVGTTRQKFPSVAIGGDGSIIVTWTDWRRGNYPENSDIFFQRFDSSLNKIGVNLQVNHDGTGTSQRDARISADRMGNACIIWSDSTSSGWNVMGQMIDNTGAFRDENFRVNEHEGDNQLIGDVALDGYSLYMTWVDDRNGHFDIYARLKQYNDPTLIALPSRIDISLDKNDPAPDPIDVIIQNAGYGEIDYRLSANQSWIELSKTSGSTMDSFTVTINTSALNYGAHIGQISLIDVTHGDSTAFIPVTCTITGPTIALSTDSLSFQALIELGDPGTQAVRINNSSTGSLDWSLEASDTWITLDPTTGSDGDIVTVGCDITSLTAGDYSGFIIVTDTGAVNNPETLFIALELFSDIPYLVAEPPTINYQLTQGETVTDSVQILNYGGGTSAWTAQNFTSWLTLNSASGSDDDFFSYTIETASYQPGYYSDSVEVSDANAFNNPLFIPFDLAVTSFDTIMTTPANAETGGEFQIQVYLQAVNSIANGTLTFSYDNAYLRVDSILPTTLELADHVTPSNNPDSSRFTVDISQISIDSVIAPGEYHLCDIYATANDSLAATTTFQTWGEANGFFLQEQGGTPYPPYLNAGDIDITLSTAVDDWFDGLPGSFELAQNYPNPFNNTTTISYSIGSYSSVKLEIFNILGQKVKVLVDESQPPGDYKIQWDGRDVFGSEAASGIYLYRLTTDDFSDVKKLMLLK